ncbi:MAG: FtsX-like permease family protein [Luteitalea sp.]|nr:FtsX-like permease family protein [Luteitalea sp.]
MRRGRIVAQRLRSLLRRSRAETDMQRELDLHIEQLTTEHIAAGMSEADARLAARREFGSLEAVKERCRDTRGVTLIEDLLKDVAYAFRLLARSPGFTLAAVLSLALGIGANTAIFSLVDAVLLRMLPVHEPQQLVEVGNRLGEGRLSYPMYEAIRDRNDVFSGVLTLPDGRFAASVYLGDIDAGDVHVSPVSGDYFAVLGVSPVIGRALTEADLVAANTTVIGYGLWRRAFGADPAVLGKGLRISDRTYTIVGVAPADFTGVATGHPVDLWVPITWTDRRSLESPATLMLRVMARRKPGVSEDEARANMELLARQWSAEWKFEPPMQVDVTSARGGLTQLRQGFSRPLLVLMSIVTLLLLMTAANVANLLLARASARQREIGVRLSLGASRSRLIRQLLTESVVLGGTGAALGLLLAPVVAAFLVRFLSSAVGTIDLSFSIDTRVLAFTLSTSIGVVLLFGLAPALAATRLDLSPLFKGGSASVRGQGPTRPGRVLVVAQVAISGVLLVGAVLFTRSLQTLTNLDAGFRRDNVLLLHVNTAAEALTDVQRVRLYERVLDRLASVPGVRSAALSSESLFSGNAWSEAVNTPSFAPPPGADRQAVLLVISPGFFRTLGTSVLRGRDFNTHDHGRAPTVAIVNEAMARYYFGETEAVERAFRLEHDSFPQHLTVVGLVQDAKYRSLREAAPRIVYLPYLQVPGQLGSANIAVRTAANPEMMADLLWKEVRDESPYLRLGGTTTQARLVEGTIAQDRMLAQLSGFFGLTAAVLVSMGLYGLTAYDVSRRTAEIGVRIALGAQPYDVVRLVLSHSMVLVASGVALGLAAALALARLVETLLFGVHSTDVITLALSASLLLGVGASAAYWPARRAAGLDPIASLRHE